MRYKYFHLVSWFWSVLIVYFDRQRLQEYSFLLIPTSINWQYPISVDFYKCPKNSTGDGYNLSLTNIFERQKAEESSIGKKNVNLINSFINRLLFWLEANVFLNYLIGNFLYEYFLSTFTQLMKILLAY